MIAKIKTGWVLRGGEEQKMSCHCHQAQEGGNITTLHQKRDDNFISD